MTVNESIKDENQYTRKVRNTKSSVHEALVTLLKEKSLQQISIKELCRTAGINRSTFYHHYGSQYEVLNEMGDEFLEDIVGQLSDAAVNDQEGVERQVAQCFQIAKDNTQMVLLLLNHSETFAERLFSLPQIGALLGEALAGCTEEEKKMTIDFAIHGACHLLVVWLEEGCVKSPEEEAAMILRLARRVCRRESPEKERE